MTATNQTSGAMADVEHVVERLSKSARPNSPQSMRGGERRTTLTIGQIYLRDNPLVKRPLTVDDIKPRLLGHWETSPGLSFIYAHASRLIRATGQSTIWLRRGLAMAVRRSSRPPG